jgi:hypothetical protein
MNSLGGLRTAVSNLLLCGIALIALALGAAASPAWSALPPSITAYGDINNSGNYVLGSNLTSSGADCITINADEVGIDLKGHSIKGAGTGKGITDDGISRRDIVITNGSISNFDTGIDLSTSHYATILEDERLEQ